MRWERNCSRYLFFIQTAILRQVHQAPKLYKYWLITAHTCNSSEACSFLTWVIYLVMSGILCSNLPWAALVVLNSQASYFWVEPPLWCNLVSTFPGEIRLRLHFWKHIFVLFLPLPFPVAITSFFLKTVS